MEDLNPTPSGDAPRKYQSIDPSDDLSEVIRSLIASRDACGREIDFDEVLQDIETRHPEALLRRGRALARKACRRLIADHVRRISGLDPESDGSQIALPGLERIPSHVMYEVAIPGSTKTKVVAKHTRHATLEQHEACLALKQINTRRCLAREAEQQRIIDLLKSTGCNSLREWEERYGKGAA